MTCGRCATAAALLGKVQSAHNGLQHGGQQNGQVDGSCEAADVSGGNSANYIAAAALSRESESQDDFSNQNTCWRGY